MKKKEKSKQANKEREAERKKRRERERYINNRWEKDREIKYRMVETR